MPCTRTCIAPHLFHTRCTVLKVAPETLGESTPPVWYRRFVSIPLIVTLCCATIPAPANAATSTATEVQLGQAEDKAILASANLVTDPLLNAWADGIGAALFAQTARKDVPYSIKLLDVPDVNAFSTLGGFIYIDAGLLDFAQSDDELAGVTGHETGHIERRHALENESKAGILSALYTLGSMFSPIVYNFGQIVAAGAMAKIERDDEYQADRYGLMLMTRAGYDPDAMVSFMQHLGAYTDERNSFVDAYLADHPDTPKRVAALVGYPELDPTVRTPAQRLAAAIHDLDEARYAIAARDFSAILAADPGNTIARYHLGEAQIALGADAQAEANLNGAAAAGSPQTRALAETHIAGLHVAPAAPPADLQPLRDQVAAARQSFAQAAVAIETRVASGRRQSSAIAAREQTIAGELPDLSQLQASSGSRIDTMLTNLAAMSRALDAADAKSAQTLAGAGSAVNDPSGGLIRSNGRILAAMDEQLAAEPLGAGTLAALPDYPRMLASLAAAEADMVRAVDAARASLAVLDLALGDLDAFVRALHAFACATATSTNRTTRRSFRS